jgi:hypothetical protein
LRHPRVESLLLAVLLRQLLLLRLQLLLQLTDHCLRLLVYGAARREAARVEERRGSDRRGPETKCDRAQSGSLSHASGVEEEKREC